MPPAVFYPLTVLAVDRLTADAAALTFAVPPDLRQTFAFRPGQSLTVRRGDERRSYSICVPPGSAPRIGVREVPDGCVSGWLVRGTRPGDTIEVQPPSGAFTPDLAVRGRHVLIAAGSGITPVLSIAAALLAAGAEVTLLYGNRRADTVMFADEVADLKDAYPTRMRLVHVLSREAQEVDLFTGRLDAAKLRTLLPALVDVPAVSDWWLCGPFGMVDRRDGGAELVRRAAAAHAPRAVLRGGRAAARGHPHRKPRAPAPRSRSFSTAAPRRSRSRQAPRSSTAPSAPAPTSRSPAKAASAAPAAPCCARAR